MPITPASPITVQSDDPRPRQSNMRGIGFMALGLFLFAAVDMLAKMLTASFHPIQIMWVRQSGLLLGVAFLFALRGPALFRTSVPRLQMARGVLAATSGTLFIMGVAFVPLADAVAVTFIAPFLVTVMGAFAFREPVGIRRWIAVGIGFVGTLIVIRPGAGVVHPAVVLILLAAAAFAMRQILSRALASSDRVETTVAYTAVTGSALLSLPLAFIWQAPTQSWEITALIGIAILAAVAETLVIKALQIAQAVVVAPVQYSMLIYSVFYGWLVFHQLPDLWTWIGALIIVATGLYTLNRERLAQKQRPSADTADRR